MAGGVVGRPEGGLSRQRDYEIAVVGYEIASLGWRAEGRIC